jgi:hypothetical protein
MSENHSFPPRELDSRINAGVQVNLWWSPADDRTWVVVRDIRANAGFVVPVQAGERARDVFDHPYAYAACHGISTTARAA